jgi:hypothetical protein
MKRHASLLERQKPITKVLGPQKVRAVRHPTPRFAARNSIDRISTSTSPVPLHVTSLLPESLGLEVSHPGNEDM